MELFIKRIANQNGEKPELPRYMTEGAAAFDLTCNTHQDEITICAGESVIVPTGIAIELSSNAFVGLVFARSGMAIKHGISLSNSVGVIDSDYRGEIKVGLINTSKTDFTIKKGDRIAQLAVMPVAICSIIEKEELSVTERNEGGFGSTGKA